MSIYGEYRKAMGTVMNDLVKKIEENSQKNEEKTGEKLFEHLSCRIKNDESMCEKYRRCL